MELSANVEITDKGVEEVAQRKFKLSIKKRSVLIQLSTPKTVQALLQKTVYPAEEVAEAIESLVEEGFIVITSSTAQKPETARKPDYNIAHPSAFRFVVNEKTEKPETPTNTETIKTDNVGDKPQPSIVRVNAFRFVVKQ